MKYGLSKKQLDEIIRIIADFTDVEEAVLFGSRAIDTFKEASDVDIAIKGKKVSVSLAAKLKYQFEEETYLPFFCDFVAWSTITNEELKKHIRDKGVVIYRKVLSEWKEAKLNDIAVINPTESLSKGTKAKKIAMTTIQPFSKKAPKYSVEDYKGGMKFRNGDTLVARITPCLENGKTVFVDILENGEIGFGSTEYIVLREKHNVSDKHFLYYLTISPEFRDVAILSMTGSSGRQRVQTDVVKNHLFSLPPLPEQKAIASVLSSLDDKIDLLHRQNKTLEALAETLFRQWFVEEAKEDWWEDSLLEVIQLIGGGTPKTAIAEYWDGDIPWLAGGDIASNHKSFINHSEKSITEVGLKNSSAKLLPKYATVISARGTVGKYCLLAQPVTFSQSNYGILPSSKISECFFFTYLLVNHVVEELQSSAYGSVFDTITTTTFKEIKVSLPTEAEILRFEQSVSPCFKKMFLNKSQILTLEKLRDTLLPKLMSGEVRVEMEMCNV